MAQYKSELLNYLNERGYIYQLTDLAALDELLATKKIALYAGFDLTAGSLHIGSLLPIMVLRILQKFGHKPIILLGSATTKIGDPSGKDSTRTMLNADDIKLNKQGIEKIFAHFLSAGNYELVDNEEWIKELNYVDFLREVGSKFSVNQMLRYESVKQRLEREQNLSFLEFNYMILQAFDFAYLRKNNDCMLQIGGSDQWGNIVNGIELNRKLNPNLGEIYGLTTPLLVDNKGKKMGKTEKGAIWLDKDLLSAYDYFQFFRNITDDKLGEFLRFFTELDINKIKELETLEGQELNQAKEILAFEVTKICHGELAAIKARDTARQVFNQGLVGAELPVYELEKTTEISLSNIAVELGVMATGGEVKRIIKGGGGKIDGTKITDPFLRINYSLFKGKEELKISLGKKKHFMVKLKI
ncbi:MAG: tyrosine--tRNA ligase [Rickettsiales bacterium]